MNRLYLRLAVPFFILFALPLLLIHTQPDVNPAFRDLLMSSDCDAPCFMGIRPGVTTGEEAGHILETSGWTDRLRGMTHSNPDHMSWIWNSKLPYWIEAHVSPSIMLKNDIVFSLNVRINASFGQVEQVFGRPPRTTWVLTGDSIREPSYFAYYPELGIRLSAYHRFCDLHAAFEGDNYSYLTYQTPGSFAPSSSSDHQTFYSICKYLPRIRKK